MSDEAINQHALQVHLEIIQSIIQRMASNSASCKAWCIAIVSAILILVTTTGKPQCTLIAIIPTVLFLVLDAYYLALERMFRQSYNSFIAKLHAGKLTPSDLYVMKPTGSMFKTLLASLISFSIWPFYLTLLVIALVTKSIVF